MLHIAAAADSRLFQFDLVAGPVEVVTLTEPMPTS